MARSGTSDIRDDRLEHAQACARARGLDLHMRVEGLTLSHDGVDVRGDFSRMRPRVRAGVLSKELLVRACRVKGASAPVAMDCTAGLGEDSFLLAASGFSVTLLERNPVVAALLADAMERARKDPELAGIVARMTLVQGDALDALDEAMHDGRRPDVVYLDPMFPEKRRDAVAKKKLQLIQRLEAPCDDESALLDAALTAGPRKVAVKRPLKGPFLAGRKPSYGLRGKTIRYDCYVRAR